MTEASLRPRAANDQAERRWTLHPRLFPATSCAAVVLLMFGAAALTTAFPHVASAETSAKPAKHKIRSAHFIAAQLTKKGYTVNDVRRRAQVYFVKVSKSGSSAILAIDGYSSEIIGLKLLAAAAGITPKAAGSGPRHFTDITYEFGYIVAVSVYESYTVISSVEMSSTSEYSYASYAESEEVAYEAAEDDVEADLDQGTADDATGDDEADANNDADDGTADDSYDASDDSDGADDASDDNSGDDDGGNDDNGGNDDGGEDDGGGDDG